MMFWNLLNMSNHVLVEIFHFLNKKVRRYEGSVVTVDRLSDCVSMKWPINQSIETITFSFHFLTKISLFVFRMIFKSTWIVWTLSTPLSPTNTTTLTFAPRKMSTARAPWKISAKSFSGIGCECPRTCWNSTRTSPAWMSARRSTIWRKPAIRRRFGSWNPASASIISIIG